MKDNNLIKKEFEFIDKEEAFASVLIISSKGSVPRTAGTKMLVKQDGSIIGTIGGGSVEAEAIKKAKEVFKTKNALIIDFNLTMSGIETIDMICGGGIRVLISLIEPNSINKEIFGIAANLYKDRKQYLFLSDITDLKNIKRSIIFSENLFKGDASLSKAMIKDFWRLNLPCAKSVNLHNETFLIEPCEPIYTLFIFGAGHVSMQLAKLSSMVGFYTVAIDDREEFANKQRFETADELITVKDFKDSFDCLKIDKRSFIAIITRGHLHDKTVLSKALKTNASYIGMIGSKKKREAIYKGLIKEGFSEEKLRLVSSPIGIEIKANSPEEIAVSIAAELIKARAEHKKNNRSF
jgi:xanthine dehydrogenase accessory factor